MMVNVQFNYKIIFFYLIFLSVLAVKLNAFLWIGLVTLLFVFAAIFHSQSNIILFFIFSLLVVTSDINETLRITLNVSALSYFIYIFIKNNGFLIEQYPKLPKQIILYVVLTIILMMVSSIFSEHPLIGFNETLRQSLFFALCYFLYSYITSDSDINKYIYTLITAAVIIAVIIVYSFLNSDLGLYVLQTQGIVHEGGSFKNVTAVGGIFSITIPLTLVFLLQMHESKEKYSSLLLIAIFIQILGLFLTNSRSGLFAVIISSSIIFFMLRRNHFKKYFIYIIVFIVIFYFVLPAVSDLFAIYFRVDRIFENTRFQLWDMSISIIRDNWVFGTGPGQFKNYMYNHLPVMLGSWEEDQIAWIYKNAGLGESHNFFLFRTAELGIFGFVGALFLPFIFIGLCFRVMKLTISVKQKYYIAVGIFSMGAGIFIRALFESTGLLSNGWIIRDLPFWICFLIIIHLYVTSPGKIQSKL